MNGRRIRSSSSIPRRLAQKRRFLSITDSSKTVFRHYSGTGRRNSLPYLVNFTLPDSRHLMTDWIAFLQQQGGQPAVDQAPAAAVIASFGERPADYPTLL